MMNIGSFGGGITPERRAMMAQALAGGNDKFAPLRQAMMARRMMPQAQQQDTGGENMVSPGTAANGGWQTSMQDRLGGSGPLGQAFSGNNGLLSIIGRLFGQGGQQQAQAAPAQPYMRDMSNARTREMAMAMAGRQPGDVVAPSGGSGGTRFLGGF